MGQAIKQVDFLRKIQSEAHSTTTPEGLCNAIMPLLHMRKRYAQLYARVTSEKDKQDVAQMYLLAEEHIALVLGLTPRKNEENGI